MNSGTISGGIEAGVQFSAGLASVVVDNSGAIDGATVGLGHGTDGTMALTNSGTIAGGVTGVESNAGGSVTLVNSGTISGATRSEEHTSELQSLMRISYAVFCLKKKKQRSKNMTTV